MRSLVISGLLYACETWTLTADILKKLQATEMRSLGNCLASHTEITSLTMQSERESGKPLGPMMISWPDLNHSKETQVKVVRACIKIIRVCQDDFTRNSARREKKRPTKEAFGEQHRWMDRVEVLRRRKRSWKQNKMGGEGCNVHGAPTVIDYGISAGAGSGKLVILKFACGAVQMHDCSVHSNAPGKSGQRWSFDRLIGRCALCLFLYKSVCRLSLSLIRIYHGCGSLLRQY